MDARCPPECTGWFVAVPVFTIYIPRLAVVRDMESQLVAERKPLVSQYGFGGAVLVG